jgi:hypothetical protein
MFLFLGKLKKIPQPGEIISWPSFKPTTVHQIIICDPVYFAIN